MPPFSRLFSRGGNSDSNQNHQSAVDFDSGDGRPKISLEKIGIGRWLTKPEIPIAQAIEVLCFGDATDTEIYEAYHSDPHIYSGTVTYDEKPKILKPKLVGFYFYQYVDCSLFAEPDYFRLISLAIHPDFQRAGIGTEVLNYLKTKATKRKVYKIVEVCHEHNDAAIAFYRKFGFRGRHVDFGAFVNPDGTRSDGYVMQLIW